MSVGHFQRSFKQAYGDSRFTELVGETPSAYRARPRDALAGVPGCIAKQVTRPART